MNLYRIVIERLNAEEDPDWETVLEAKGDAWPIAGAVRSWADQVTGQDDLGMALSDDAQAWPAGTGFGC